MDLVMRYLKMSILACSVLYSFLSLAETIYLPVLSNGKTWEVATFNRYDWFNEISDMTGHYNVLVAGDTIVNGLDCKKIEIVQTDGQCKTMTVMAREENGKVWKVKEDGSQFLLFDVGLKRLDPVEAGFVVDDDVICVNGVSRKRLKIDSGVDFADGEYYYYVVEGVGVSKDEWISDGGLEIAGEGEYCRMLSCSENGEVIFTVSDFKMGYAYDIADVNAAINIMLGKIDIIPSYDMNNDGHVDIADVNAIINIMLGK